MLFILEHPEQKLCAVLLSLMFLSACDDKGGGGAKPPVSEARLGEMLFHDANLSLNRTQSCATCHDPLHAFSDPRPNQVGGAVSMGDDGISFGNRNSPTLTYIGFTPVFHLNSAAEYRGGFFHDGRAATLAAQAGEPLLNPVEMNMPNKAEVIRRLQASDEYYQAFEVLFGSSVWSSTETAWSALTHVLAEFQHSDGFSSFDSRYDRWIAGQYILSAAEERGRQIFFTSSRSSCVNCHRMGSENNAPYELFTNHHYHHIGTPINHQVRSLTGLIAPDQGLGGRVDIDNPALHGAFKTPTLRNVAVTGPYLHNGVLQTLEGVIEFYNFRSQPGHAHHTLNPETGEPWAATDYPDNISNAELMMPTLSDEEKNDLVAFLRALTDQRYEQLLND